MTQEPFWRRRHLQTGLKSSSSLVPVGSLKFMAACVKRNVFKVLKFLQRKQLNPLKWICFCRKFNWIKVKSSVMMNRLRVSDTEQSNMEMTKKKGHFRSELEANWAGGTFKTQDSTEMEENDVSLARYTQKQSQESRQWEHTSVKEVKRRQKTGIKCPHLGG